MDQESDLHMVLVTQKRRRRSDVPGQAADAEGRVPEAPAKPEEAPRTEPAREEHHHHHRHYNDYGTVDLGRLTPAESRREAEVQSSDASHEMDAVVLGRSYTGERSSARLRLWILIALAAVLAALIFLLLSSGARGSARPDRDETVSPVETIDLQDL